MWIPYCSGDTWTGTTTSNPHLHGLPTTGHNIIEAVVDHLINTSGFDKATHVLLSGGSAGIDDHLGWLKPNLDTHACNFPLLGSFCTQACVKLMCSQRICPLRWGIGGIGVFHNADWLSDTVKTSVNPNAVVKASPQVHRHPDLLLCVSVPHLFGDIRSQGPAVLQAGYFFPENVTLFEEFAVGIRIPFDKLASDYVHWLEGGFMNQACAAALGEKKSLCWDISVVQKYLKTPLFVAQNQIDAQQVG